MKRTLTILAFCGMFAFATATVAVQSSFWKKYDIKPTSKLAKEKCLVCHTKASGGSLNKFGLDLKAAKVGGKVTDASFDKIATKDSDGDGKKNIDEIKADSNPGAK